jgi:REP element-mobilizing transposase RayT
MFGLFTAPLRHNRICYFHRRLLQYNPNIHHRRSIRLPDYDYSQQGLYFVTVCVQDRECLFGNIEEGEMRLNEMGRIVRNEWLKTAELRSNVELHEFVVMPNHFHAILEITEKIDNTIFENDATSQQTPQIIRPYARPTDYEKNEYMSNISPKLGSLAAIMRSFKSSITRNIHILGYNFAWQRNMWEHVIRDTNDHARIAEYIHNNPANWDSDMFYKK